jgi:hypothetical protein
MKTDVKPIQETSSASNIPETMDNVQRDKYTMNVRTYEAAIFMKL